MVSGKLISNTRLKLQKKIQYNTKIIEEETNFAKTTKTLQFEPHKYPVRLI